MAGQFDPNTYPLMCRCQLSVAASVRTVARERKLSISAFLEKVVNDAVAGVRADDIAEKWMRSAYEENLNKRKAADLKTADGEYRVKHPKKRGRPPKAKKRGRPPKRTRKVRCDKGIPRGPRKKKGEVSND